MTRHLQARAVDRVLSAALQIAIAVAAVTIFADRAITTLAQDPSQGEATHRLANVRRSGLPVFVGGLLLELWPFL